MEEQDNTQINKELDDDMDAAFRAAADELGIDTGEQPHEEREGLQETEEGRQEEVLEEVEASPDRSELQTESLQTEDDDSQEMPQSWGKKDAKVWEKLPADARAKVKQRELELTRLITGKANEYHQATAPIKEMLEELEPYAKQWRAEGITKTQGVLKAVALMDYIKTSDKLELAKEFLRASGKGPEALIDTPESSKDRTIRELRERLDGVESTLGATEEQRRSEPVRRFIAETQGEYEQFLSTKNAFGGIKYPSAQNPEFARALGSLVSRLAAQVPDANPSQLIQTAYERLGGQIDSGNLKPRLSNNNNNTTQLKAQARSGFGKGKTNTGPKAKYESDDDAWNATLAEFDLLE